MYYLVTYKKNEIETKLGVVHSMKEIAEYANTMYSIDDTVKVYYYEFYEDDTINPNGTYVSKYVEELEEPIEEVAEEETKNVNIEDLEMMNKIKEIMGKKIAIHCKDEFDEIMLMNMVSEFTNCKIKSDSAYWLFGKETCYEIMRGGYCSGQTKKYYKKNKYKIITYDDFVKDTFLDINDNNENNKDFTFKILGKRISIIHNNNSYKLSITNN